MIYETEKINQHILGVDKSVFFIGTVENRDDPLAMGRCQIRITGTHPDDKSLVPTEDLPWAYPILPVNNHGYGGLGHSSVGPLVGTKIFGFFADGMDKQIPWMLGTIPGGTGQLQAGTSASLGDALSGFVASAVGEFTVNNSPVSSSIITRGATFAKYLLQDLNNSGYKIKDFHAAAIMGNIAGESNIQAITEGHSHPGPPPPANSHNVGYGFAQWTNSRLINFLNYCSQNHLDPQTDKANIQFLSYELKGSFKTMLQALASGGNQTAVGQPHGPHNVNDIVGATAYVLGQFERPAFSLIGTTGPKRINYAKKIWEAMKSPGQPVNASGTHS